MQELSLAHTESAIDTALDSRMWGSMVLVMLVQVRVAVTQAHDATESTHARSATKERAGLEWMRGVRTVPPQGEWRGW